MKNATLIIRLFVSLWITASVQLQAQNLTQTQNALAGFNVSVSNEFFDKDTGKKGDEYTPAEKKMKKRSAYRIKEALLDSAYKHFIAGMEAKHNVSFLPLNYLENIVPFNEWGFPVAMGVKSGKKSDVDFVLRLDIMVTNDISLGSAMGTGARSIKPLVTCRMSIGNDKGKKVFSNKSSVKSKTVKYKHLAIRQYDTLDVEGVEKLIPVLEKQILQAIDEIIDAYAAI